VRKNPHTSGTARQTRTSLKPYCCSTHLNVFSFKICVCATLLLANTPFPTFNTSTHFQSRNFGIKLTHWSIGKSFTLHSCISSFFNPKPHQYWTLEIRN
jgi:hypothetical protein